MTRIIEFYDNTDDLTQLVAYGINVHISITEVWTDTNYYIMGPDTRYKTDNYINVLNIIKFIEITDNIMLIEFKDIPEKHYFIYDNNLDKIKYLFNRYKIIT
jgi:hypothetical protein